MATTKEQIQAKLKPNEVLTDFEYLETGVNDRGFPLFTINFITPPNNHSLVQVIEPLKVAILTDLDYATEPINS